MPEYCKKVRWKELKPRSNYRTQRKSPELAEETTPRHRANDVVVDDADFEGPRDEATLKGTACLKKVLGVVVAWKWLAITARLTMGCIVDNNLDFGLETWKVNSNANEVEGI